MPKSEAVHERYAEIRDVVASRGWTIGQHKALERLTNVFGAACEEHGLDIVLLALCNALYGDIAVLLRKAGSPTKGDSPAGGDLESRANTLLAVYDQVRAAHAVATGG